MKLKLAAILALSALLTAPAVAQPTDVNSIIASIGDSQFMRAAGKVDGASSARVVRLSSFMGAKTAGERLARAEAIYERDLAYLHGNLLMSPIVMQAIRASGFDVNSIVALSLDGDGSAILYADDL
ncbi:MAG: hypothetical protein ACTHLT_00340 [Devosia sp.]